MMDKSKVIFGNAISNKDYKSALKSKKSYQKKFGDDSNVDYKIKITENDTIGPLLGVSNVVVSSSFDSNDTGMDTEKGIIVGNIRMGFGHYRISMAMASYAHHLGYTPYWMDLNSYQETTCTKVIGHQNDLYSLGSRLSKIGLFNKLVWEPTNYEGFRALSYNSKDQKNAELMAPVYRNVPKDIPVIATHAWPAQAAVHAGMKHVVNAIPDNWPMALHLSEGSVHTIQCKNAYMGYRILNGMNKKTVCKPMPQDALVYTGHYIDYELVSNIEKDCKARIDRRKNGKPMRFLLTIGGAGAQKEIFAEIIKHLLPRVKDGQAVIYVNVGDYRNVWDELKSEIAGVMDVAHEHMDDWQDTLKFAEDALDENKDITGIHSFYHKDIFKAVYATNLLMRSCDVLVTKPSELAFYPVPKLFIKRVGKHEMWGAIHSAEIGDGTLECRDIPHTIQMLDQFLETNLIDEMCESICLNNKMGIYDGAKKVVELAVSLKNK
ncbi:DUF6937 domain-containing protein [Butyrivibrio proteoclasticus]|uniref:DUF6937 domain-containing protein n=1 Tax=Butyrivibrio proteoclasticus TaxID=43305 RepID=UPI00047DD100|nr:hypothetical protein [Butyrivibrio proteoclasticus]